MWYEFERLEYKEETAEYLGYKCRFKIEEVQTFEEAEVGIYCYLYGDIEYWLNINYSDFAEIIDKYNNQIDIFPN